MCKIIAFTDTRQVNLKKCINDIGNTLLKSEKDGFGYAVQGKEGVFGEKCIKSHFRSRVEAKNLIQLPIVKHNYLRFGVPGELQGAGIFHGRTSTNADGLINTHPMQRPSELGIWHLVHNGVVSDHGPKYSKLTDNDSEDVLYRLMEGIDSVEQHLTGYYAFAAIDPDGYLHIARDEYATLYIAWSEVLNTYIVATTETLILKVNKMLDAKVGPIDEVEDNVYMVFERNELIHHQTIKPRGFTRVEAVHSQESIGRSMGVSNMTSDFANSLSGGELVTLHHRGNRATKLDAKSEADWQNESNELMNIIDATIDAQDIEKEETDYYKYRHELDNMDASYEICDQDGTYIKLHEFKKLDHIAQELCTIIRGDGTVVELDGNQMYTNRLG